MISPLKVMVLQTPARLYSVASSETAQGGRQKTKTLTGTIWGDFQPDIPAQITGPDGRGYIAQTATFICRTRAGMRLGDVLNLKGFDWTILTIDEAPDNHFRLRIESAL